MHGGEGGGINEEYLLPFRRHNDDNKPGRGTGGGIKKREKTKLGRLFLSFCM